MGLPQRVPGKPPVVLSGAGDTPPGSLQLVLLLDRRLGQRIFKKPAGWKPDDILRSLSVKGGCHRRREGAGSTRTGDGSGCKLAWNGRDGGSEKPMGWGTSRSSPGVNEAPSALWGWGLPAWPPWWLYGQEPLGSLLREKL